MIFKGDPTREPFKRVHEAKGQTGQGTSEDGDPRSSFVVLVGWKPGLTKKMLQIAYQCCLVASNEMACHQQDGFLVGFETLSSSCMCRSFLSRIHDIHRLRLCKKLGRPCLPKPLRQAEDDRKRPEMCVDLHETT